MEKMELYEAVRSVPETAKREIQAGRLKGKTDINPMWRLKTLTEQFGPCGFGWAYEITAQRLEPGAAGEIAAFVDISLYVKDGGQWSRGIPGSGGAMFVAKERGGLYTDDECYKKALTDALSVACKALGMGADVYWDKDSTKYSPAAQPEMGPAVLCQRCGGEIRPVKKGGQILTPQQVKASLGGLCVRCFKLEKGEEHGSERT